MGYILTNGTSILTNYVYDDSLGYGQYIGTKILACDSIPSSCPLLDSKKYSIWDITFSIQTSQFQGYDHCFPYITVPFRMNWHLTQLYDSNIGYDYVESVEVLSHSQDNARLLDYVNGEIYGPEYTQYQGGEIIAGGYTGEYPEFCTAVYDHAPGYFLPNNELAKWSISYKIRITFNAPVSVIMLKKAIEYGAHHMPWRRQ